MAKSTDFLLHPQIEKVLKQIILKDLVDSGNKEATEKLVALVKEKIKSEELTGDSQVLLTATYAWFWADEDKKRSAEKIEHLLYQRLLKYFSQQQIFAVTELLEEKNEQLQELARIVSQPKNS